MILVLEILPKNKIPLENTSKGTSKHLIYAYFYAI